MAKTGTASQEESPALREQTRMPNIPLKITAIYGLAGALWILFSDRILGFLVDDASVYAEFSTFKGWLFVAVTAAFLHRLVAREQGELERSRDALREREELLTNVLDTMPVGVWLLDRDGKTTSRPSALPTQSTPSTYPAEAIADHGAPRTNGIRRTSMLPDATETEAH